MIFSRKKPIKYRDAYNKQERQGVHLLARETYTALKL